MTEALQDTMRPAMLQETTTYRAVQVVSPGQWELTAKPVVEPPFGHVRIRVEACGVCHSDAATVDGSFPIAWPRVPGHEVVGRIDALGEHVEGWTVGQRVGVGFLGGHCGHCGYCRAGDFVHCQHQGYTGIHTDGGYAEVIIAKASGLMAIPDALPAAEAAPLLCAGLTTFSALRNAPAKAGDLVAVLGIGGLGHLAVQYARHMGFEVAAIGRGTEGAALAQQLGAHHYIASATTDVGQALQALGGAAVVVATAPAGKATSALVSGVRPRGHVIAIGVAPDPLELSSEALIFGSRSIDGALTGDPATGDATLKFSVLAGVRPMIETMALTQAPEAYAHMLSGKARFRVVLTM
jgi:propanol-preferring alcohol dehydrogenase